VPSNPIHPDPAAARAAALGVPIAVACVRAGARIIPRAEVTRTSAEALELAHEVLCEGTSALVGRARGPLPGATS
jgi:acyl dehydratase